MASSRASALTQQPALTIGHLEASYSTYCKALRILIRDGYALDKIKRTVCWERLQMLHDAMPRQYRDPVVHYGMLKRHLEAESATAA